MTVVQMFNLKLEEHWKYGFLILDVMNPTGSWRE